MKKYEACPVCNSPSIGNALTAKDHSVSKKIFSIWECKKCTLRFTQDIPEENEIAPYYQVENYISHSNTDKGLINKLYHFIRTITLRNKKNIIKRINSKESRAILDVGSGTGAFVNTMKLAGWNVDGIEPDKLARNNAQNLYGITLMESEQLFHLPPASYDVITLWHVLEHVHHLHEYLDQFFKLLLPKGKLVIAVPNYTSYDAKFYKEFWAAYDVPRHLYHFSPQAMKTLLEKRGFALQKKLPMWYDSYYVSMLSEQYKNERGNLIRSFFIGILSNMKAIFNKNRCSSLIYIAEKT